MSMFSTTAPKPAPEATVDSNGYRSTQTISIGPILWVAMASAWSAASRTPSRPPWTTGCRVLTRPSIISGKPVRSATSFTGRPKPAMAARVPPVETSSTPSPCRVRAASSSPVLSLSEISARFGATRSGAGGKSGAAGMAASVSGVGSGRRGAFSTGSGGIEPLWSDEMENRSVDEARQGASFDFSARATGTT